MYTKILTLIANKSTGATPDGNSLDEGTLGKTSEYVSKGTLRKISYTISKEIYTQQFLKLLLTGENSWINTT